MLKIEQEAHFVGNYPDWDKKLCLSPIGMDYVYLSGLERGVRCFWGECYGEK
jgi:hypothetical protein